jgi:hypothetical protein
LCFSAFFFIHEKNVTKKYILLPQNVMEAPKPATKTNAMPWPKIHQVPQKGREWRMTSYNLYHTTALLGLQSLEERGE